MSTEVKLTKLRKDGVGRTIGSEFGFGSFTIGATSIEVEIDPPIDLTTDEGREKFVKLRRHLAKLCQTALNEDVERLCVSNKELAMSKEKRDKTVNTIAEHNT